MRERLAVLYSTDGKLPGFLILEKGEMAKKGAPQIEDGYTRVANEILEALAKTRFTNSESRLITAILRLTYGIYGRKKAELGLNELAAMTELRKDAICIARKALMDRGVLLVSTGQNKSIPTYRFNKYYKKWKVFRPDKKSLRGQKGIVAGKKNLLAEANNTLLKENIKKSIKESKGEPEKTPAPPPPPYQKIIEYLNAATGSKYDHTSKETRAAIRARFKTGYTEQDFYDVISVKTDQWLGDNKMVAYLRPSTLFRPTNFEDYLQEARRSKTLLKSEKTKRKERRFKIAAGIMRESGQEACLRYCQDNNVDAEEFKTWISKNIGS